MLQKCNTLPAKLMPQANRGGLFVTMIVTVVVALAVIYSRKRPPPWVIAESSRKGTLRGVISIE
jgi:hypothetical protein